MTPRLYLPDMAVASCLGMGKAATVAPLFAGEGGRVRPRHGVLPGSAAPLGALATEPAPLVGAMAGWDSRNNRLLAALATEIADPIERLKRRHGADRIAVVVGTSTSGIAEGDAALAERRRHGVWPSGFHYRQQETGGGALLLARLLGLSGPAYAVATACSSAAKALASARRLIRAGLADAAIAGGADTLCRLTVAGFASLEALSPAPCNPFSANRRGIAIGEGGALFILAPEPAEVELAGIGESSDAHHPSAPDPSGDGALAAMAAALADACLAPAAIGYVNLHGTATLLNDAMEARAMARLFAAAQPPASSTKALTGHALGAAGALEAAILWLTLSRCWNPLGQVPPHRWDGVADPALPPLNLADAGTRLPDGQATALSNSFAFGGSNCCLALRRDGEAP